MTVGLNQDTLGGILKAALSQFLALEIARMSADKSESKITKYMPWLFNPPNTITTQVSWLILPLWPDTMSSCIMSPGSQGVSGLRVSHQASLLAAAGRHEPHHDGGPEGLGPALSAHSTRGQLPHRGSHWGKGHQAQAHYVEYFMKIPLFQVILAGFAEQSKTSVVHMWVKFTLCIFQSNDPLSEGARCSTRSSSPSFGLSTWSMWPPLATPRRSSFSPPASSWTSGSRSLLAFCSWSHTRR